MSKSIDELTSSEIIALANEDHAAIPQLQQQQDAWGKTQELATLVSEVIRSTVKANFGDANASAVHALVQESINSVDSLKQLRPAAEAHQTSLGSAVEEAQRFKEAIDTLSGELDEAQTAYRENPEIAFQSYNGAPDGDSGFSAYVSDVTADMRTELRQTSGVYETQARTQQEYHPRPFSGMGKWTGPIPKDMPRNLGIGPDAPQYRPVPGTGFPGGEVPSSPSGTLPSGGGPSLQSSGLSTPAPPLGGNPAPPATGAPGLTPGVGGGGPVPTFPGGGPVAGGPPTRTPTTPPAGRPGGGTPTRPGTPPPPGGARHTPNLPMRPGGSGPTSTPPGRGGSGNMPMRPSTTPGGHGPGTGRTTPGGHGPGTGRTTPGGNTPGTGRTTPGGNTPGTGRTTPGGNTPGGRSSAGTRPVTTPGGRPSTRTSSSPGRPGVAPNPSRMPGGAPSKGGTPTRPAVAPGGRGAGPGGTSPFTPTGKTVPSVIGRRGGATAASANHRPGKVISSQPNRSKGPVHRSGSLTTNRASWTNRPHRQSGDVTSGKVFGSRASSAKGGPVDQREQLRRRAEERRKFMERKAAERRGEKTTKDDPNAAHLQPGGLLEGLSMTAVPGVIRGTRTNRPAS